jgi:hypothetical protein
MSSALAASETSARKLKSDSLSFKDSFLPGSETKVALKLQQNLHLQTGCFLCEISRSRATIPVSRHYKSQSFYSRLHNPTTIEEFQSPRTDLSSAENAIKHDTTTAITITCESLFLLHTKTIPASDMNNSSNRERKSQRKIGNRSIYYPRQAPNKRKKNSEQTKDRKPAANDSTA